ncbi:MAG: Gfo/Idh/MocA family oxidoreductase [Dysgonamonadaceae bacterium]|jgi:predicted dehydrogenase|nr:Gfo/Idh/MocA family oxidoreductase [Dysgonamonadaceae bacterium]
MNEQRHIERRTFLKAGLLSGISLTIIPRRLLGGPGFIAPSDEITKGVVGVGSMGFAHLSYIGRTLAVCDVDSVHLTNAHSRCPSGAKAYHDYRELLLDSGIDVVHIATPPHWHGIMAVDAAKAGKDVWCECPMTRTVGEGIRVKEAMARYGAIFRLNTACRYEGLLYGMNIPVKPIKKLVENGLLGWPLKVTINAATGFDWKSYWVGKTNLKTEPVPENLNYDLWLGPAPYKPYNSHRVHNTFRGYWDYSGGGIGEVGQQYLDPVQYILGKDEDSPVRIDVDAPQQHWDACGSWKRVEMTYDDGCKIILDGENKDTSAAYIEGPNGKLFPGLRSNIPQLDRVLAAFPDPESQFTDFHQAVRNRRLFALNERNGFRSCTLANLAIIAVRLGRSLDFDPLKLEFVNDEAANHLLSQPMRAPWTI